VVWGLANHFGLAAMQVAKTASSTGTTWGSLWILLTRDAGFLAAPGVADGGTARESREKSFPLWSDDSSSLLPLLKASAWDPRRLAEGGDERHR